MGPGTGGHSAESSAKYAYATVKERDFRFSYYCNPAEFAQCMDAIADGDLHWQLMLTGSVGIDGVASAFDTLLVPKNHIKVIVEHWRSGGLESSRP